MKNEIQPNSHIYFIGIGGISMSGLAEILKDRGCRVSGTDIKESDVTKHLESLGISIHYGHRAENITDDIDLVVYTAAIHPGNPELEAAKEKQIPLMDRARLLGHIMEEYQYSVAVAGTHGKTTTTSMVSEILLEAEKDPTITVGGILPAIHSNVKIGHSPYFVAEACEYFDSFLQFTPLVGVILNVEADHLDYFKTLDNIRRSFHAFAQRIPAGGLLVLNASIAHSEELEENLHCSVETFGLKENACWQARNIVHGPNGKNSFDVYYQGEFYTSVHLDIPGEHNITNALAAVASAHFLDIPAEVCARGLSHFTGVNRRFQRKGEKRGIVVIDDYAHHPTEIMATLSAARNVRHNKLWCVFQPHTYTRTKQLLEDFVKALSAADHVVLADIYAARETDTLGVSSKLLAEKIAACGTDVHYFPTFDEIETFILEKCVKGDLLITMGAGDVVKIGEKLLGQ